LTYRCRLEAHVRHADTLRRSYDVGLAATSYVLVATEQTGQDGREQFFLLSMYRLCASGGSSGFGLSGCSIFLRDINISLPRVDYYPLVRKDLSVPQMDWNFSFGRIWNDLF
jgi:hypothetical protein